MRTQKRKMTTKKTKRRTRTRKWRLLPPKNKLPPAAATLVSGSRRSKPESDLACKLKRSEMRRLPRRSSASS